MSPLPRRCTHTRVVRPAWTLVAGYAVALPAPQGQGDVPGRDHPCQLEALAGSVSQLRVSARSERVLKIPLGHQDVAHIPPLAAVRRTCSWPPAAGPAGSACQAAALQILGRQRLQPHQLAGLRHPLPTDRVRGAPSLARLS